MSEILSEAELDRIGSGEWGSMRQFQVARLFASHRALQAERDAWRAKSWTDLVQFLADAKDNLLQQYCNLQLLYGEQKHALRRLQAERDALKDDLATILKERNDFEIRCDTLKAELAAKDQLYHELLYQVGNKYPNESRHETALRYLKRAEQPSNDPAKQAKP